MGGRDDRPAARRARTYIPSEPAGSGPDAETQRPAAGPGLEDALHAAPALLAALAMRGDHSNPALRLVSKACREAVDGAATRTRLDFDEVQLVGGPDSEVDVVPVARWLAKLTRLADLSCYAVYSRELEQLLAMAAAAQPSAVAGVQRLVVVHAKEERAGEAAAVLLRSLAHLPSLQVC
jgi:hypothetical protein